MSYLVKFNSGQGETREETFETEQQVLECKDKDSIISIQKNRWRTHLGTITGTSI